jgi:ubiquinone/menaquinone biosynthesis C-methylase UbiE
MTSTFDLHASQFERYRALPGGVPETIRNAIWSATGKHSPASVLDVGAGTGRFGKAFVAAGDSYVGLDLSYNMLHEFRVERASPCLVQADAEHLPFQDKSFDVVMLMQVLSGARHWRELLKEVQRVLRPGGTVVVGHTVTPQDGVDAQLKQQLNLILDEMKVAGHEPKKTRGQALSWLESTSVRRQHVVAASWTAQRTAGEFLDRHRSGARFSSLPAAVQTEALKRVRAWAEKTFGSLDKAFPEQHNFELDIFGF